MPARNAGKPKNSLSTQRGREWARKSKQTRIIYLGSSLLKFYKRTYHIQYRWRTSYNHPFRNDFKFSKTQPIAKMGFTLMKLKSSYQQSEYRKNSERTYKCNCTNTKENCKIYYFQRRTKTRRLL